MPLPSMTAAEQRIAEAGYKKLGRILASRKASWRDLTDAVGCSRSAPDSWRQQGYVGRFVAAKIDALNLGVTLAELRPDMVRAGHSPESLRKQWAQRSKSGRNLWSNPLV